MTAAATSCCEASCGCCDASLRMLGQRGCSVVRPGRRRPAPLAKPLRFRRPRLPIRPPGSPSPARSSAPASFAKRLARQLRSPSEDLSRAFGPGAGSFFCAATNRAGRRRVADVLRAIRIRLPNGLRSRDPRRHAIAAAPRRLRLSADFSPRRSPAPTPPLAADDPADALAADAQPPDRRRHPAGVRQAKGLGRHHGDHRRLSHRGEAVPLHAPTRASTPSITASGSTTSSGSSSPSRTSRVAARQSAARSPAAAWRSRCSVDAKLDAWARAKVYEYGVHLIALEMEGDMRVRLVDRRRVGHRVAHGRRRRGHRRRAGRARREARRSTSSTSAASATPTVRSSASWATACGRSSKTSSTARELTDKLNRAIDKKRDRLVFRPAELLKSDWWPLARSWSSWARRPAVDATLTSTADPALSPLAAA